MELKRENIKIHTAGKYNEINRIGIIELNLTDQEIFQMIEELIVAKRNQSVLQIGIYDESECKECSRGGYIKKDVMRKIITCKVCKKKVILIEENKNAYIVCECHFLELDNLKTSFPEDWNF